MKAKNFGTLPSSAVVLELDFYSGCVGRLAESLKAIGIGYLVNLNHKHKLAASCERVAPELQSPEKKAARASARKYLFMAFSPL
jgi:hypothetical protein